MVDVNAAPNESPTTFPCWRALADLRDAGRPTLRDLFASDPDRGDRLGTVCADLWIDRSRQHLDEAVLDALTHLAEQRDVVGFLRRTADGEVVNGSEKRPASHQALRLGRDAAPSDIVATRDRMATLATAIRAGEEKGATGSTITALVQLGIGGSHLGPALAVDALAPFAHPDIEIRFSSSVDADDLAEALDGLDPASTLVIACSKSFTTIETLTALDGALAWLAGGLGDAAINHVLAVTAAPERAKALGVDVNRIYEIPVAVGGRFSLGSAVGLPVMVAIGPEAFDEMLDGMRVVDNLSATEPPDENAAIQLALIDVWNRCHLGRSSLAVVPYAHRLRLFAPWLQQLSMESLGKGTCENESDPETPTGPTVWGATGTDAQHAFFQLIHQGTDVIPVDLIGVVRPTVDDARSSKGAEVLMTNLAAQADALAFGRTADEVRADGVDEDLVAHRTFPGNRPSTAILLSELTPSTLGQLIALYENRTVAMAAVLGINPFDQWGVELGKKMALDLANESAPESALMRRASALRDS